MLSYFSRVGPRAESSSSSFGRGVGSKELPSTPVRPTSSSSSSDEKRGVSPTQLRLEDLGTPLSPNIVANRKSENRRR